jgi:hypothetical protein
MPSLDKIWQPGALMAFSGGLPPEETNAKLPVIRMTENTSCNMVPVECAWQRSNRRTMTLGSWAQHRLARACTCTGSQRCIDL